MPSLAIPFDLRSKNVPFRPADQVEELLISDKGAESNPGPALISNVFPTPQGYATWNSYELYSPNNASGDEIYEASTQKGMSYKFAVTDNAIRSGYIGLNEFVETSIPASLDPKAFFCFSLRGQIYAYWKAYGLLVFSEASLQWESITVKGPAAQEQFNGMCAANSFAVAWDEKFIYWSAVAEANDFVPSLITGAGSTGVLALQSKITVCAPITDGFIIYTDKNAIAALFTGNLTNPWTFSEIAGCNGVLSRDSIAVAESLGTHIIWSNSAFQQVAPNGAKDILPEFSNLVQQGVLSTGTVDVVPPFTVQMMYGARNPKIGMLEGKYLWVNFSYIDASGPYVNANFYIYNIPLQRWGHFVSNTGNDTVALLQYRPRVAPQITTYQQWLDTGTTYNDLDGVRYMDLTSYVVMEAASRLMTLWRENGNFRNIGPTLGTHFYGDITGGVTAHYEGLVVYGPIKTAYGGSTAVSEVEVSALQDGENTKVFASVSNSYSMPHETTQDSPYYKEAVKGAGALSNKYYLLATGPTLYVGITGSYNLTRFVAKIESAGDR